MLRTPVLIGALLMLAPPLTASLSAAELPFACRLEQSARAMATCADAQLAAADRELEAAYESILAHLDAETATALREDQKKFRADLDRGFGSSVWGSSQPPRGAALRAAVAELRRTAAGETLAGLEAQLRERITFLRGLAPPTSVTGLWKNHDAELLIVHVDPDLSAQARSAKAGVNFGDDDRGHYDVTFGMTAYGLPDDHCHFTAKFRASAEGLLAPEAHNTDPGTERDIAGKLQIARAGPMTVVLTQSPNGAAPADQHGVCPKLPALTGPLFHTNLRLDQAFRLKP
jgi:hypothetical protein